MIRGTFFMPSDTLIIGLGAILMFFGLASFAIALWRQRAEVRVLFWFGIFAATYRFRLLLGGVEHQPAQAPAIRPPGRPARPSGAPRRHQTDASTRPHTSAGTSTAKSRSSVRGILRQASRGGAGIRREPEPCAAPTSSSLRS